MDQQNNRAVPGAAAGNGQPQRQAEEGQGQPAPVWEGTPSSVWDGTPEETPPHLEAQGWDDRPGAQHSEPGQGWGAPPQAAAPWGTTPAAHQGRNPGTGWGAPARSDASQSGPGASGNRTWTAKRGIVVGGVAVVVAAAAGAGAYAAGNSTSAAAADGQGTAAQGAAGQGQFGPGGQNGMTGPGGTTGGMDGGPGGLGMGMGGLNAAIHSEYVILQGSTYVAMAGQTGTVTSVTGSSLVVKSDDGFTRTYAVDSSVQVSAGTRQRGGSAGSTLSLSDITAGASVRVTAVKDADSYTAESIQLATGTSTTPNSGTSTTPNSGTTTN